MRANSVMECFYSIKIQCFCVLEACFKCLCTKVSCIKRFQSVSTEQKDLSIIIVLNNNVQVSFCNVYIDVFSLILGCVLTVL